VLQVLKSAPALKQSALSFIASVSQTDKYVGWTVGAKDAVTLKKMLT